MKTLIQTVPGILCFFISTTLFAQESRLISFDLQDQFKREYSDKDFRGQMIVLIGSDGGGSSYNGKWGKAISDELKKHDTKYEIHWLGLADLSNAPFFMRGVVRKFFPDDEEEWILMDWEGHFATAYSFASDMSNILVFNAQGKLVFKTNGKEVHDQDLEKIVLAIKENY